MDEEDTPFEAPLQNVSPASRYRACLLRDSLPQDTPDEASDETENTENAPLHSCSPMSDKKGPSTTVIALPESSTPLIRDDVEKVGSHKHKIDWRHWLNGRDAMLWLAFASSFTVLCINLIVLIIYKAKGAQWNGLVTTFEGSCSLVSAYNTIAHVAVNILSTLLFGASNTCMQLLSAPSRKEIEKCHRNEVWLDVGIQSFRNLRYMKKTKAVILFLLAISSLPLHLIYNSVISQAESVYDFNLLVAKEAFLHGGSQALSVPIGTQSCNHTDNYCFPYAYDLTWNNGQTLHNFANFAFDPFGYRNLSKWDCAQFYLNAFAHHDNLLLIFDDAPPYDFPPLRFPYKFSKPFQVNVDEPYFADGVEWNRFWWSQSNFTEEKSQYWTFFGHKVKYCVTERRTRDHYRLEYSATIMTTICLVSTFKCLCILFVALDHRNERSLCTVGDAIRSFLEIPDPYTKELGPVSSQQLKELGRCKIHNTKPVWNKPNEVKWHQKSKRFLRALPWTHWLYPYLVALIFLFVSVALLAKGIGFIHSLGFYTTVAQMWHLGWGKPIAGVYIAMNSHQGWLKCVLLANVCQQVISLLYMLFNRLLTSICLTKEWAQFAQRRKPLRVTHPIDSQRSSYFISLPWRYGAPFMASFAVLHFLVSQAIFLSYQVCYFPTNSDDESPVIDAPCSAPETAFSPLAALIAILWGVAILSAFLMIALKKAPADMPLVGSCSAAISANCQRPNEDSQGFSSHVQWGTIVPPGDGGEGSRLGWCSFTGMPVHTQMTEGNDLVFGGCHDERGPNNENVKIDEEAETRRKAVKDHDPFSRLEGKVGGWWVILGKVVGLRDEDGKRKVRCKCRNE